MASTNQSPEYQRAEKNFLESGSDEERIRWLEEMIRECPKHKSAEKMLANLKTRYIKLKEKIEKQKKSKKTSHKGLKKADMQAVLVGFTNSGKSSILKSLTNTSPEINNNEFTTKKPLIGIMEYEGVQIQIIDLPSVKSEFFDIGIVNTADLIILVIVNIEEISKIKEIITKVKGKLIIVLNKTDLLNEKEKRKISETLKSKKYNFIMVSTITNENIEELKKKIFESFEISRIYLKEPGKNPSEKPLVMKFNSTIEDIAKKISNQMVSTIKEVRIWGPSSKFPNQKVGLQHKVKDKDIVEFHTR
ncbi:MAG: GTPase [Candidatus Pacearchaeota archaeon]